MRRFRMFDIDEVSDEAIEKELEVEDEVAEIMDDICNSIWYERIIKEKIAREHDLLEQSESRERYFSDLRKEELAKQEKINKNLREALDDMIDCEIDDLKCDL